MKMEGTYPLYRDGRSCGCYATVPARAWRAGLQWRPCPLHADTEGLVQVLEALLRLLRAEQEKRKP